MEDHYKSSPDYQEELKQAVERLREIEAELFTKMINLATLGKWKEWSKSIPVGGEFKFTEEMLRDTGDENVNDLCLLMDKIVEVQTRLTNHCKLID